MIPIIIPAYEPDERLISLLKNLNENGLYPVIVVNDGSDSQYSEIFNEAERLLKHGKGRLLVHETNRGKGRALKTAFEYVRDAFPDAIGVVTADSDGQHTVECMKKIISSLSENPKELILGVRDFTGEGIPWKSRFGNTLTEKVFAYVAGVHVSDTQTGLRGIPYSFMEQLLNIPGERFEFEMQMLLESAGKYPIREIKIKTIYDSEENHQTHFNPITDSIKIYKILGKKFLRYIFASGSSSVLDVALFTLFCHLLRDNIVPYAAMATVFARIISAVYNYCMNYKVVFKSGEKISSSGIKYGLLAIIQMTMSAFFVTLGIEYLKFIPEVLVKVIVDTILFFVSYHIQQRYVFQKTQKTKMQ